MKILSKTAPRSLGFVDLISILSTISYSFGGEARVFAAERTITILHTNDLHSHFRENKGPLRLGGLARIKTAVDEVRKSDPGALLVDGGDWSEGDIYYTEGTGAESLRMMDRMGYDVAVLGNHDWINGPDVLLDAIKNADPHISLVAANLSTHKYAREEEFNERVLPYVIKKQGDVKIAFIGLSTFEFVFDQFFAPIKITEPFLYTRELASRLKREGKADIVVAVSHNSVFVNKGILKVAPAIDLIIGGHDHKKLMEPAIITRSGGRDAWVVETGCWGEFLGRVDLSIDENKNVKLLRYRLTQIDSKIPEDQEILDQIGKIEGKIETRLGPIFTDQIGESHIQLERRGLNSGMGNLVTDAYLHTTGADFSMESIRFIYGELHPGIIRTVDAYNANPAVYDKKTQKSWTVKILPMRGKTLQWLLNTLYASKKFSSFDLINVSGLQFIYDPIFSPSVSDLDGENVKSFYDLSNSWYDNVQGDPFSFVAQNPPTFTTQSIPPVSSIKIQGQPIDPDKTYRVATGGGLIEGLHIFNSYSPFPISLEGLEDTGLENWRVLADYIHVNSPLTEANVPIENRIQTLRPDLAVYYEDIQFQPLKTTFDGQINFVSAKILVHVRNYGATQFPEKSANIRIFLNENGNNQSIRPKYLEIGAPVRLKGLNPKEDQLVSWEVNLPLQVDPYEIAAKIESNIPQIDSNNLDATRWFKF